MSLCLDAQETKCQLYSIKKKKKNYSVNNNYFNKYVLRNYIANLFIYSKYISCQGTTRNIKFHPKCDDCSIILSSHLHAMPCVVCTTTTTTVRYQFLLNVIALWPYTHRIARCINLIATYQKGAMRMMANLSSYSNRFYHRVQFAFPIDIMLLKVTFKWIWVYLRDLKT